MPTLQIPSAEATTTVGRTLPRTTDRDRRRAAPVSAGGLATASLAAPKLDPGRYLAIEDGEEVVVVEVGGRTVHLGRSTGADVILDHLSVSRRHAVVVERDEALVILDDRSLNGVVVNGERVSEAVLRHGDEIRLGDVAMRYVHVH
jgi:pSer/pThr/pTyr-binding forkhead associated (FHA) protein